MPAEAGEERRGERCAGRGEGGEVTLEQSDTRQRRRNEAAGRPLGFPDESAERGTVEAAATAPSNVIRSDATMVVVLPRKGHLVLGVELLLERFR